MRSIDGRLTRALVTAAAAALLLVPAGAQAGDPKGPSIELETGVRCIDGAGYPPGATVTVKQRKGTTVLDTRVIAGATQWRTCFGTPVRAGQRITAVAKDGSTVVSSISVVVPKIVLGVDPIADLITIHAEDSSGPLAGAVAEFGARQFIAGWPTGGSVTGGTALDPEGNASEPIDIGGAVYNGDRVFATFQLGSARVGASLVLPSVVVRAGSSVVTGTGAAGTSPTVRLRSAAATLRGSVTAPVSFKGGTWRFAGSFRKNGATVPVKVGNTVTSSALAGSGTVLANTLALVAGDGTGEASVTCPAASRWVITVDGVTVAYGVSVSGTVTRTGMVLASGDAVTVSCMPPSGFGQRFARRVP